MYLDLPKHMRSLGFVLAYFLSIFYLLLFPYAATKQGDFVHLWIGGRSVVLEGGAGLYSPATHLEILKATGYPLATFWGPSNDLIGAFYYPPPAILWYGPLALFPLATAQVVQALVTWSLVLLCGALLANLSGKRLSTHWAIALLFMSPPVFHCFALGQNGVMSLAIVLSVLWLERRKSPFSAGAALGLLIYKPTWLVSLLWYPVLAWKPRFLLGISAGVFTLILLSAAVIGFQPFSEFLSLLAPLTSLPQLPGYSLSTQCSVAALARVLFKDPSVAVLVSTSIAVVFVVFSALALRSIGREGDHSDLACALILLCASCINPHLHHYDLSLAWASMLLVLPRIKHWQSWGGALSLLLVVGWAASFFLEPIGGIQIATVAMLAALPFLAHTLAKRG